MTVVLVGSLFPLQVPVLINRPAVGTHSALACQISSKLDNPCPSAPLVGLCMNDASAITLGITPNLTSGRTASWVNPISKHLEVKASSPLQALLKLVKWLLIWIVWLQSRRPNSAVASCTVT